MDTSRSAVYAMRLSHAWSGQPTLIVLAPGSLWRSLPHKAVHGSPDRASKQQTCQLHFSSAGRQHGGQELDESLAAATADIDDVASVQLLILQHTTFQQTGFQSRGRLLHPPTGRSLPPDWL